MFNKESTKQDWVRFRKRLSNTQDWHEYDTFEVPIYLPYTASIHSVILRINGVGGLAIKSSIQSLRDGWNNVVFELSTHKSDEILLNVSDIGIELQFTDGGDTLYGIIIADSYVADYPSITYDGLWTRGVQSVNHSLLMESHLHIPIEGTYQLGIFGAGLDGSHVHVGNTEMEIEEDDKKSGRFLTEPVHLDAGEHILGLQVKPTDTIAPHYFVRNLVTRSGPDFPSITIERINPTKYVLTIDEINEPKMLVLSNTYADWIVEDVDSHSMGSVKRQLEHIVVNGYANAWIVQPEDGSKFTVYYRPQGFYFSMQLTALILFLVLIVLGFALYIKKKHTQQLQRLSM
jgi:hypothetical protein